MDWWLTEFWEITVEPGEWVLFADFHSVPRLIVVELQLGLSLRFGLSLAICTSVGVGLEEVFFLSLETFGRRLRLG